MSDFQTVCKVCKSNDDSVWEVVNGIGLCGGHQEEWFSSKLPVAIWLDLIFAEQIAAVRDTRELPNKRS